MWWLSVAHAVLPDVDAPLRTGASAPADAAVVIGIEDYAFLADVPSATRDGRTMYNFFVYTRGLAPEQVTLLSGGNREQILAAVATAKGKLGPGGTLWITWAGHGATNPDDGGPLLVGDDAKPDPTVFVGRSVKVAELPREAVVVLDTCWAGRGRDGAELVPGTRFAVPAFALAPKTGALLTAAQPSQLSEPYAPADHGLYSYFFAGATRGWADGELDGTPDGVVTLREAHAFVGRALATVRPTGQQPTFAGEDRVLVAAPGRLEPAPDLSLFPKANGSSAPVIGPVLGTPALGNTVGAPRLGNTVSAFTGAPLLPTGKTWTGALTFGDDWVVVAGDGTRMSLSDAAAATIDRPAVGSALGRTQSDRARRITGYSLMAGTLIPATMVGYLYALDTITEPAPYLVASLIPALAGTGFVISGSLPSHRHREELLAAINAAD